MPASVADPPRDLDLVVWGATGFTGSLVARAVAARAPRGLRWAIAGRNRERLEALRSELGAEPEVLTADAEDEGSLHAMAHRTAALVSTVGPFARFGTPVVAACVAAGTDYADISGEAPWIRRSIDRFHERARDGGVRIVHACGFDSVPSDLGTWRLQTEAARRHGRPCDEVVHVFGPMAGGLSGGTIASALDMVADAAGDDGVRRDLADPDLLAPGAPPSRDDPDPWWPLRHEGVEGWTAPFAMAAVNEKVVRRTRALLGEPWGAGFRYRERLRGPTWARAAAIGAGTAAGPTILAIPPLRRLARRALPEPGEGPGERIRERGFFRTRLVGRTRDGRGRVTATVESDLDPGYGATARMLAEMGLGLAEGEFDTPGGVLTPAVVGGMRLVERLDAVGVRVRVQSDP